MSLITVTASNLCDAEGNKIVSGEASFQPCNDKGVPIPGFNIADSIRGISGGNVVTASVTNGALSVELWDSPGTRPQNVCYLWKVCDIGGNVLIGPFVIQPTPPGPYNLDTFEPNLAAVSLVQNGPRGYSAYEVAVQDGFVGSEEDWITSLKGETGNISTPIPNTVEFESTIIVDGQTLEGAVSNNIDAAYYVTDNDDRVALYVDGDGNTHISGDLSVAGDTDLSVASLANAGGEVGELDTELDYALAVYDGEDRIALGIDGEGDLHVSGSINAETLAYDGGEVTDLDSDFDYAFAIYDAGDRVAFAIRSDGKVVAELADGTTEPDVPTDLDINQVVATGQSLMVGYQSNPPLSTTQPYNNIMFNGGPCVGSRQGVALDSSKYASFQPLIEVTDTQGDGTFGETMMSAFANRVAYELAKAGRKHPILATVNGYSGSGYTGIKKGTATYSNGITLATAAKSLAATASKSYGVQAVLVEHGQADEGGNNTAYAAALAEWQANYETDYQTISGQTSKIPFIITQMSEWTRYAKAVGIIPYLQIAASTTNPDAIMIATATYFLTHYADGLHLTNDSERILGEYMAKPYVARMQGRSWRPLSIKSAVLMGKTIIADFNVPVAPIVIDTTTVTEPSFVAGSKYGFEFDDGSGSPPAITSITVVGPTTLEIVLASTPASGTQYLNYGYTGASGVAAGPTTGPRGCLRDSDTWRSLLGYGMTINGVANALPNWCLHQHFQL